MTTDTVKAKGYQTATVIAHIMDMDVDAAGNAEKAAWKRYMALALLAQAKAMDKKKVIEAVFGKGGKPSKTFQNMWSMADKARNTVLGNRSWDDIRAMDMDEARNTVLDMINRHMATLDVSSKNDYDKVCNLSPSEAQAKRDAEAASKAEADAEKAAEAEKAKLANAEAEAQAKEDAASRPERTPSQAAIAVLEGAGKDDLMQTLAWIASRLDIADLEMVNRELTAIVANHQTPAQTEDQVQAA